MVQCVVNPTQIGRVGLAIHGQTRLKYIHIKKGLLFLVTTLNRIQHVSHHSIADARAVLPASPK